MRHSLSLLLVSAMLLAGASLALAQEAKTDQKADTQTPAQLQAEMHRAMAALIEARAAEKPDEAKIAALFERVQTLRGELWAQGPVPAGRTAANGASYGWQCPWGGPAVGRGMGPGKGFGYGPGKGLGYGPGKGLGYGPGKGFGFGYGPGYAYGQGRGWGGPGKGYGCGRGCGMCAAACAACPYGNRCVLGGYGNDPVSPIPSAKPAQSVK